MTTESSRERRRHPRVELPKGVWVAWQGAGKRLVNRVRNLSLSGMFIYVADPPPVGTTLNLLVDAPNGELRGRALVRRIKPGEGMGVEFTSLSERGRGLIVQLLKHPEVAEQPRPSAPVIQAQNQPRHSLEFEREMQQMLELAETGTYYQLLGVTANSSGSQIKARYYQQARKFHPDRHMGHSEWVGSLQKLMSNLAEAYKTLTDEEARRRYDQQLARSGAFTLGRVKSEMQETAEECLNRAMELLRAKNYRGSILWLRRCVEISPEVAKYHALLARSLAAVPRYRQEAIEHFQKAIELDRWNVTAYLHLAELYEGMKLPWRASPLYQKILEIDPEHSKARERLRELGAKVES